MSSSDVDRGQLAVTGLLQQLRASSAATSSAIPPSGEHMHDVVRQLREMLLPAASDDAAAPSSLLQACCASGQYASIAASLFRNADDIDQWSAEQQGSDFFAWFLDPIPAGEAFMALALATRSATPATSSAAPMPALAATHSLLTATLQRFVQFGRLGDVLRELCVYESQRASRRPASKRDEVLAAQSAPGQAQVRREVARLPAAAAASASTTLSPHAQSILDTLCSFPALVSNALQANAPYSLSQAAWTTSLMQALVGVISELASGEGASTSVSPLSGAIAKLMRLGHAEIIIEQFGEPLLTLLRSSRSAPSVSPSLLLTLYAHVAQGVGVQSMESFVVGLVQWLGYRLRELPSDNDAIEAKAEEHTLLSVLASLFPLSFFDSSPFFSLLLSKRLFLTRSTLTPSALRIVIAYVADVSSAQLGAMENKQREQVQASHQSLLDRVLLDVLQAWTGSAAGGGGIGDSAAATTMSPEVQIYLSRTILLLLEDIERATPGFDAEKLRLAREKRKATKADEAKADDDDSTPLGSFANSPAVSLLLTGVHTRLSSSLPPVRLGAMKIASTMSRMMAGPGAEIDFGLDDVDAPEDVDDAEEVARKNQALQLNPSTIINPLHLGDRPALQPSSLVDDEKDLRKVPLPRFLRDALDLLHKQADSFDHMEAALEAIPALVRRHPPDLPLLASSLAAALLNAGSNVFMDTAPKLARNRVDGIVALCSTMGLRGDIRALEQSVAYVITQFYSGNYSIGTKVELLDVLRRAAESLADMAGSEGSEAATAALPKGPLIQDVTPQRNVSTSVTTYSSSASAQAVSATLSHHQAIIRDRVEKRTKRWGSTKAAAEGRGGSSSSRVYSVNRFAPVAHLFFYPLIKPIDQPGALTLLQQHDSLLLIRLLHTLSAFLPCSSGLAQTLQPVTRGMAKVLMEYLLMCSSRVGGSSGAQLSAQIGMRRMIFFALSRILVTYNERLFADDFASELPELVSWLTEAVQMDKDHECRQLAQANLYFLKQLVGDSMERLFKNEANAAAQAGSLASAQLPALRF